MARLTVGAVVLAMAAAGAASAQPIDGVYVSAGIGANYVQPVTRDIALPGSGIQLPRAKFDSNVGFAGLGSIGYAFGGGFRLEVEGSFRQNDANNIRFSNGSQAAGNTTLKNYAAMGNLLYDFDVGSSSIYPYVGGGAGYAWTDAGDNTPRDGRLAAQGIFGAAFPIEDAPGLSFTLEYRFFALPGTLKQRITYDPASNTVFSGAGGGVGGDIRRGQQFDHSIMFGLRYAFETPQPPAPPAAEAPPVAAPARSYLIFFDWDRATLTARARQIVHEAADNVAKTAVTRIEVNGYTDTSGTPKYNQGLSVRRAQAVEAELVRDGVPKSEIAIQGFGETRPLVPTAAGVREPQNRRVEIILH